MKNFLRAVRYALRFRTTLVAILLTSILVGSLWGANIGVVYPFVEIVFQRKTLDDWINTKTAASLDKADELRREITDLQNEIRRLQDQEKAQAESDLQYLESQLNSEMRYAQLFEKCGPIAKKYLPNEPFQTMVWIVVALLLGTALKCFFLVANMILVQRVVQLTTFDLRKQFHRQALRWDLGMFGQQHNGELLSRFTNDMQHLAVGLDTVFGKAIREPLKMIACLALAAWVSWQLLVFSLLVAPPSIFLMRRLAQSIKRANRRAMEEMALLYQRVSETFSGIQTVRAFTMEQQERNRFHQSAKELYYKAMKIVFYNSLTKPISELLGIGVISLSLVAGAYLVVNQETHILGIRMCERPLSLGALLLFYSMLAGISDPARKLSEIFTSVQGAFAAADRVYAVLDREPSVTDPKSPKTIARPHGKLAFDNVSFAYQTDQPVLADVNAVIPYGETLAIVGPNGCGKTTLVNLVPRFYDSTRGAVRLDGVDIRDMRMRSLRERIGLVTQQPHLFYDSVLNNIRYGSPQATDEEVVEAAKKAHAHRFITQKLADGYETIVGQSGSRLSGGQRQRIALARAILRDPEILILDEATSQIDLESEQAIHRALESFTNGRTAIIITHRLSTLALASRILVMETGRVVDIGSHDELMERCPLYRRLHELQFRQSA
jgi:ATP-binding cassette subfamily B protein/subfamily B ATP-binding cassette protein MsbA